MVRRSRSASDFREVILSESTMNRKFKKKFSPHFEHDDRDGEPSRINVGSGEVRHVKFVRDRRGGPGPALPSRRRVFSRIGRRRNAFSNVSLDEDDLEMVSAVSSLGDLSIDSMRERDPGIRKFDRRSRFDKKGFVSKLKRNYSWYKITVLCGAKFERKALMDLLISVLPSYVGFSPYSYKVVGADVTFYVGNYDTAMQLERASGRILDHEGQKVIIRAKEAEPEVVLNPTEKEKIKLLLARRYNIATKSLDLSKLYDDMNLKADNFFVPLSVPNVLLNVIKIIGESIPDLHALDMSGNKIFTFPSSPIREELQNLKILHLANNKFVQFNNLLHLKNLDIEELVLTGNPLSKLFKDQEAYVKEARKFFPKLVRLDGIELPPVISFDTGTPTKLLPAQASFFCDPAPQEIIKQFILQYFHIYDSDNRAPLMEAYDDRAQFSLSCSLPHPSIKEKNLLFSNGNAENYTSVGRNLCKIKQPHQRKQKLQLGKDNIVKFLCSLPKTQHDPTSFTVDLTISTPVLLLLSLSGVFRERPVQTVPVIRAFSRTFVIVPVNSGYCIINELLFVGKPTLAQAKAAFKSEPVAGPSTSTPITSPVQSVVTSPEPDIETKKQMVIHLANITGMNLAFSERCLSEMAWDYEKGLAAFNELKARNSLPPEAFIK